MNADIIVFGSIAHDLISYTEKLPRPGETITGISFEASPGGKGANQAIQAARLGAKIGDDIFGEFCVKNLEQSGIMVDFIEKSTTARTATATIIVSTSENMIVITLGANLEMKADRAVQLYQLIASAKIILCQNEIDNNATKMALEIAKKNNVKTFLNFAPCTPTFDKDMLKNVDILCVNEIEAESLSGRQVMNTDDALMEAESFLNLGPSMAIITLGAQGAIIAHRDDKKIIRKFHVEAFQVNANDTTGAGDSFCGALAYFFVKMPHLSLEEQLRRTTLVASISVQRKGTQKSYPWASEIPEAIE
ncbi:unnamed protein product [Dracunculus medinensis]|uniref:Ribokinase n=1 Tax=Dracunculus medinensis TaxID=318479 RepID=A0A0N4UGK8_DRAME|nr:unnamed protein product [Dracunculus medinensis]